VRRWARRISIAIGVIALILGVALAIVRHYFSGPRLGRYVAESINHGKRPIHGRVEIDSIDWNLADLPRYRSFPIVITGARVFDPRGAKILDAPKLYARIDLPAVLFDGDIRIEDLIVDGAWALVEEYVTEDPEHPSDVGLIAAFRPKRGLGPGEVPPPGPIFEIRHVELRGVELLLHFQRWRADLHDLRSSGASLWANFRQALVEDLDFNFAVIPIEASRAELTIGALAFDLKNVHATRFGIFRQSHTQMDYDLTFETSEGARVHARGALKSLWKAPGGVELALDAENAGALAARLSEGKLEGADVKVNTTLAGAYEDTTIQVAASGVDVKAAPAVALSVTAFRGELHPSRGDATVHDARVVALGGEVAAKGTIDLHTLRFKAEVRTLTPVDLSAHLDPKVVKFARGGQVTGILNLEGEPRQFVVVPTDVKLGKARISRGKVDIVDAEIIMDVRIEFQQSRQKGSAIDLKGKYDIKTKKLAAKVAVDIDPLAPWLETIEAAPLLRWFLGRARVKGTYDTVTGKIEAKASRVALLDTVNVSAGFNEKSGVLSIRRFAATPLGGKLTGTGKVRIEPTVRLDAVTMDASGLDLLKALPLAGALAGIGHFHVTARGTPPRKFEAQVDAGVAGLSIGTLRLGDARAQVEVDEDGIAVKEMHIGRAPQSLDVVGKLVFPDKLDLTIDVHSYPLGTLPGIAQHPELGLGGQATVRAKIGGTIARPEVTGVAKLVQVAFRNTILGGAGIKLEPWPDGRVHVSGRLFQNKLSVDGFIVVNGAFEVNATVKFRRLEVDEVLPELSRTIGAHGWASGVGTVRFGGNGLNARLALTELVFTVDGTDDNGRPRPLVVKNLERVDVEYDKGVARLIRPVTFEGPDGSFRLEVPHVSEKHLDVAISGQVRLSLLAFYTRRFIEESSGNATVNVRLAGPPEKPVMSGTLVFKNAAVRRPRQETWIRLPTGRFVLGNDKIVVENLILKVDGQQTVVNGELTLKDFVPDQVHASIKGMLAARLVEVLFPNQVSASKGAARIDLTIDGAFANPDIDGTLTFDRVFEIAPRGFRRDVALTGGKVRFNNKEILLRDVHGTVDDVATNLFLEGNDQSCTPDGFCTAVRLYEWSLVDLFVRVDLYGFTHRMPGILEVEVNLTDMTLSGDMNGLQLRGNVDVVDGRYSQGFRLDEVLRPVRVTERAEPFWEDDPLLRSTLLFLRVTSNQGAFKIENNVADLTLSGDVTITGTPEKPQFNGRISMDGGTLKLPLTRPRFTLQSGIVSFLAGRKLPEETPEIDVHAFTDPPYEDLAGTQHTINLEIRGPLGQLRVELSTDTGLNQAQTLQLITLRRSDLDDLARGRAQQNVTDDRQIGQNALATSDTFTSAADPLIKEAFSQYISILVEEPLRRALRLDCFRVVAGLESTGVYGCWDLIDNFRIEGDIEIGLRGGDKETLGSKFQLTDEFSVGAYLQRVNPLDEREEVENKFRGQLKWKYLVP
jgi:hypothetical protein